MANRIASAIAIATRSVMYATWPTPLHYYYYSSIHRYGLIADQPATDEWTDVEDLDLLDDDKRHACCATCWNPTLLQPFTAVCGKRSIWTYALDVYRTPPNACRECLARIGVECPICGTVFR